MGKKWKKNIVSAWRGCICPKLSCGSSEDFRFSWTHKCVAIFTFSPVFFNNVLLVLHYYSSLQHHSTFFWGEEYYTLKFIKADIFYFDLQIVLSNKTVVFEKTLSIFLGVNVKAVKYLFRGLKAKHLFDLMWRAI